MDIVWVYKNSGSDELEYSVKSTKHIKHRKKFIVGDKPSFEGDYLHVKPHIVRWSMLSTHHDVINKLDYVLSQDLTENFIFFNDDMFVMEKSKVPVAHRGKLDDHIAGRKLNDSYTKSLKKTSEYLKSIGIPEPLSYELHIPIVYNKKKLKEMYTTIIPLITHAGPMLTRSLYGNIYNIGGTYMADVKNVENYREYTFLSTNEKTFKTEIGEYIRSKL